MAAMYHSICSLPERQVRRSPRHDLFRGGVVLHPHHSRYLHLAQEETRCRTTLQGLWLSRAARHIHPDGSYFLHTADKVQARIYMAGTDNCFTRYSSIFHFFEVLKQRDTK